MNTMLPPELVQAHFADLKRAFELVARYEHHDIGKLPAALLDRLKTNGYVESFDVGAGRISYEWQPNIEAFYLLYAAWQEKLTAFISTMEGDKE